MDKFNRVLHLSRSVHFDCTITLDQLINIPLLNGRFKIKWKFNQPTQEPLSTTTSTSTTNTSSTQSATINNQQQQPIELNNHPHHRQESHQSSPPTQLIELPIKAEASGATDYHEIKNHSVHFRHAFHCPISINLDKQAVLQPSILTILIKEEHVNELGRRIVSRHGSIDIDLSQYTPLMNIIEENSTLHPTPSEPHHHYHHHHHQHQQQASSRIEKAKFLLRECKTNASLKLQIQMDYLGGMTPFKIAKSLGTAMSATNISGTYPEVQMTRVPSQPDDTRSIFNSRQSNTCSPGSSIISSGSSQHKFNITSNKPTGMMAKLPGGSMMGGMSTTHHPSPQTQPMVQVSSHSGLAGMTQEAHHEHPQDVTSQLAKDVIDAIFANPAILTSTHPAPSSTIKHRRVIHSTPNSHKKYSTKRSIKSSRFY
ncbi:hypothetical protein PGT21_012441 [Puccinia graminis f. sp. tritici]|uniref:C2 NT-type domain-containing protein n=1 Tax=Puccinia graminis f. sp. tritici TaxID=56615 RepID=A0A5B0R0C6_PUCGR|nr:hypothetical protein PGT21_012441 [Puccinia graminis f. sp. tritici]